MRVFPRQRTIKKSCGKILFAAKKVAKDCQGTLRAYDSAINVFDTNLHAASDSFPKTATLSEEGVPELPLTRFRVFVPLLSLVLRADECDARCQLLDLSKEKRSAEEHLAAVRAKRLYGARRIAAVGGSSLAEG